MGIGDLNDPARELDRVADRLDALGTERLERPGAGGLTVAGRVRPVLQSLADIAADGEGEPRRRVPVLAAHALADQLRVLARDALRAADEPGRETVRRRLAELRRAL